MVEIFEHDFLVVKCNSCKKYIKHEETDFKYNHLGTYIVCPNCKQNYYIFRNQNSSKTNYILSDYDYYSCQY